MFGLSLATATSTPPTRPPRMLVSQTAQILPIRAYVLFRSGANLKSREPNAIAQENVQNNSVEMADALQSKMEPSVYNSTFIFHKENLEDIIGYEALYKSAKKCFKGVGWKWSTQNYKLHLIENIVKLSKELVSGKYKEGRSHTVHISYPKKREAIAISIRDRNVQRSVNDNVLYPSIAKSLIYCNFACQHGKGTDAARRYLKNALHRAYLKYKTNEFKIISIDFKDYYGSLSHKRTNEIFAKALGEWSANFTINTLETQYKGERGYSPGSQMVQIGGIAYPNAIDHYMKEKVRAKIYAHYMDDFQIIAKDENEAIEYLREFELKAKESGLLLHPKKTKILNAENGTTFLGFSYSVTSSGKVLVFRDPKRIKEIKRRLIRLAHKELKGYSEPGTLLESWKSIKACMKKGNNRKIIRKMEEFVYKLLNKEILKWQELQSDIR